MDKASEVVNVFEKLSAINVNAHTDKKGKLTYLSWAWAWAEFKAACPDAKYKVRHWPMTMERGEDKIIMEVPYLYDPYLGYMVMTTVTVGEESHDMWLFVMDSTNKAMKAEPYTYQVANWVNGKKDGTIDKTVDAATMFDINTTLMRCLVKNLAMFGLGLYIYAGEDLPGESTVATVVKTAEGELKKYQLIVAGHLAKYPIDFIQKCFMDAGYDTKAKKPDTIISSLVDQVTDRDELKMIGENIKLAVDEANGGEPEKPAKEVAEEVATKADAKKAKADKAKEAKKKADAKIAAAEAKKKAEAEEAPSDEDPTADDSFVEPAGPDASIKAVMPAAHKPKPDEIADSVYVDYIVEYFRKMIEQTMTAEMLAEYVDAVDTAWDKKALDKLFGLYKKLNESSITLAEAFPNHYEG